MVLRMTNLQFVSEELTAVFGLGRGPAATTEPDAETLRISRARRAERAPAVTGGRHFESARSQRRDVSSSVRASCTGGARVEDRAHRGGGCCPTGRLASR